MDIDPSTTKYLIQARLSTDGIVEKPDIVGAIFGQTEGLLGDELDLRDLQKSGRIGRIEVEVSASKGKSEGVVYVPSSLDQVETAILASSLETIDRVGPCKARINVEKIEDVRISKRNKIIERAKQLLNEMLKTSKTSGLDLADSVRQSVQIEEVVHYGKERLPAGPNIDDSDAIIVLEGRSDVLNLLKYGIKNVIAVEGTNVPQTIVELSKEKVVTAFVDGDRGGELILRELLQIAEIDFIARAPAGQEVEELTQKQIVKCLRNKVPADQFAEMLNIQTGQQKNGEKTGRRDDDRQDRHKHEDDRGRHREQPRPRQVVEDEGEGFMDRLGADDVVVVQHEREGSVQLAQIVDQADQEPLEWWRLGRLQHAKRRLGQVRLQRPQRSNHIGQEARWVIIIILERETGERVVAARIRSTPLANKRGLPETGRGRDQGERKRQPLA